MLGLTNSQDKYTSVLILKGNQKLGLTNGQVHNKSTVVNFHSLTKPRSVRNPQIHKFALFLLCLLQIQLYMPQLAPYNTVCMFLKQICTSTKYNCISPQTQMYCYKLFGLKYDSICHKLECIRLDNIAFPSNTTKTFAIKTVLA